MPARFAGIVGFALVSMVCISQASADLVSAACGYVTRTVKRRQCWPEPFTAGDRASVRAPFTTMVANGWRKQNMLGEFHFEPRTGQLTEAGRLKVRWILVEAPEQHRQIYVHVANNQEETLARLTAVQQLAAQIAPQNASPVLPTTIADEGWPASEVDAISRKYIGATPVPRLPAPTSSNGGGGSSGGGGNGGT